VSGGTAPYNWTLIDGVLPTGLSLSASGKLTGEPQQLGEERFTLQVQDSASANKSREFTIRIEQG